MASRLVFFVTVDVTVNKTSNRIFSYAPLNLWITMATVELNNLT